MTQKELLKFQAENLDKVLDHSNKLLEPHNSLVDLTKRVVDTYSTLSSKEQKSLGFVYRKSLLEIIKRAISQIERYERNNVQMKAKSLSLKNIDLEELFLK